MPRNCSPPTVSPCLPATLVHDTEFDAAALPPGPWAIKAQIAAGYAAKKAALETAGVTVFVSLDAMVLGIASTLGAR